MVQNLNIYKLIVLGLIVVLSASTIVLAFVNAKSEATTRQRIADVEKIEEGDFVDDNFPIYHDSTKIASKLNSIIQ